MEEPRKLTDSIKKTIASRQNYKCANKLGSNLRGLEGFKCSCWKEDQGGSFDESGYEIDHIIEFCISHDDDKKNLQALCTTCHRVKTKRFMEEHTINKQKIRKVSKTKKNSNSYETIDTVKKNCTKNKYDTCRNEMVKSGESGDSMDEYVIEGISFKMEIYALFDEFAKYANLDCNTIMSVITSWKFEEWYKRNYGKRIWNQDDIFNCFNVWHMNI